MNQFPQNKSKQSSWMSSITGKRKNLETNCPTEEMKSNNSCLIWCSKIWPAHAYISDLSPIQQLCVDNQTLSPNISDGSQFFMAEWD